ncbi:unnamed protein product [Heterosigma akashiwo]
MPNEVDEDKRPFRALLDVGITPTTTGHRVFGALKGACGAWTCSMVKRFPATTSEGKSYGGRAQAHHGQPREGVHGVPAGGGSRAVQDALCQVPRERLGPGRVRGGHLRGAREDPGGPQPRREGRAREVRRQVCEQEARQSAPAQEPRQAGDGRAGAPGGSGRGGGRG